MSRARRFNSISERFNDDISIRAAIALTAELLKKVLNICSNAERFAFSAEMQGE
jgi:hypothetical protein